MIRVTDPRIVLPALMSRDDYVHVMHILRAAVGVRTSARIASHIAALEERIERLEAFPGPQRTL